MGRQRMVFCCIRCTARQRFTQEKRRCQGLATDRLSEMAMDLPNKAIQRMQKRGCAQKNHCQGLVVIACQHRPTATRSASHRYPKTPSGSSAITHLVADTQRFHRAAFLLRVKGTTTILILRNQATAATTNSSANALVATSCNHRR